MKEKTNFLGQLTTRIIGDPEEYSLEHRFFIASCIVGALAGILATIINLSLKLHLHLILLTSVIPLIYIFFYFYTLRKKKYKPLIIPYIFISLFACYTFGNIYTPNL